MSDRVECPGQVVDGVVSDVTPTVTDRYVTPELLDLIAQQGATRLYRALVDALYDHAVKRGTAQGALQVLKKVALAQGVSVANAPLPRLTRAQRER